jgi:hypothetical protein
MKREQREKKSSALIDLGAASRETKAMPYGADDSKTGLWIQTGLTRD